MKSLTHKINAIAPWFGGKRTMAPDIVKQLGKHSQYFEPFCGSMAVLFAKPPSQKETVNDLHADLINLALVLQKISSAEDLYDRLNRTLFSQGLLDQARIELSRVQDQDAVDRAYWYFLASWMGRNGTAGTARIDYQMAVRWTKNGGSPTVRFQNAAESIPSWHERLRNVVILKRDAFTILDRFEDHEATAIYVDAPYTAESRSKGAVKNGRGGRYLHEFNHESTLNEQDDHARLADLLRVYRNARIVVSYYDTPRIRELYAGWTFIDKSRQKHLHAQNGRGSRKLDAPEVLIINGEPNE